MLQPAGNLVKFINHQALWHFCRHVERAFLTTWQISAALQFWLLIDRVHVRCVSQMRISSRGFSLKIFSQRFSPKIAAPAISSYMSSTSKYHLQKGTLLVIQKGDITKWDGDAVVNAGTLVTVGGGLKPLKVHLQGMSCSQSAHAWRRRSRRRYASDPAQYVDPSHNSCLLLSKCSLLQKGNFVEYSTYLRVSRNLHLCSHSYSSWPSITASLQALSCHQL